MALEENLTGQIQALLLEKLLLEVQSPDENLLETGGLDSVTLIQLLLDLEEHFKVRLTLSELDLEDFSTARGLARLVAAHRTGAAAVAMESTEGRMQEAPAGAPASGRREAKAA